MRFVRNAGSILSIKWDVSVNFWHVLDFPIAAIRNRSLKILVLLVQLVMQGKLSNAEAKRAEFSMVAISIQPVTLFHGINRLISHVLLQLDDDREKKQKWRDDSMYTM